MAHLARPTGMVGSRPQFQVATEGTPGCTMGTLRPIDRNKITSHQFGLARSLRTSRCNQSQEAHLFLHLILVHPLFPILEYPHPKCHHHHCHNQQLVVGLLLKGCKIRIFNSVPGEIAVISVRCIDQRPCRYPQFRLLPKVQGI